MYRLIHENNVIGVSALESGDPAIGSASGDLGESGTSEGLSQWILSKGGVEEDGVFLLEIGKAFLVVSGDQTPVPFSGGSIICVPADDEVFLELTGIPAPEYVHFFPRHVKAFQQSLSATGYND